MAASLITGDLAGDHFLGLLDVQDLTLIWRSRRDQIIVGDRLLGEKLGEIALEYGSK